jgi:hypothetical protein
MPLLLLLFILSANSSCIQGQAPPNDFAYPPSRTTIVVDQPIEAGSLRGTVVGPDGFPLADVLVEIIGKDEKRVGAVLTTSTGTFSFKSKPAGQYVLRVSKPGFDTMLFHIVVDKRLKKTLLLQLELSQ